MMSTFGERFCPVSQQDLTYCPLTSFLSLSSLSVITVVDRFLKFFCLCIPLVLKIQEFPRKLNRLSVSQQGSFVLPRPQTLANDSNILPPSKGQFDDRIRDIWLPFGLLRYNYIGHQKFQPKVFNLEAFQKQKLMQHRRHQ